MRAVVLPEFGSALAVVDVATPEPLAGEVRVKVHAASVNGFDLAVANGYLKDAMEHRFPVVLGKDFAGTIDQVGEGVDAYAVGDRVFGVVSKSFLGDGSFGEYVTVRHPLGSPRFPTKSTSLRPPASGWQARPQSTDSMLRTSSRGRSFSSPTRPAGSATRSCNSLSRRVHK
jgi:NADPH2:quinone reductase